MISAHRQSGIALVMVLWAVVLFATLAGSVSYSMRQEIQITGFQHQRAVMQALLDGEINRVIYRLSSQSGREALDTDGSSHMVHRDGQTYRLRVEDERGRVNINRATPELLRKLISSVDVGQDNEAVLHAILDWRDKDQDAQFHGAEDIDYERAGFPYGARDGVFLVPEEFSQLKGVDGPLYRALIPHLTVFSLNNGIDPKTISTELLEQLPGLDQAVVDDVVQQRELADPETLNEGDAEPFNDTVFRTSALEIYKITVSMTDNEIHQARMARVQITGNKKQPFIILDWRDVI